jgi:hypothetical protein
MLKLTDPLLTRAESKAISVFRLSGDLLEAFPDRRHGPSGDRKSLLKMAAGRAVVDN